MTPRKKQPDLPVTAEYPALLADIKERIRSAQYEALKAVNKELVGLYWDIGRIIVERQSVEGWGQGVVEKLSADIPKAFPGVSGFSPSNLWRMKDFFETYQGIEKLAPLVREIGWTHNLVIMSRCKDPLQREFYIRMTRNRLYSNSVKRNISTFVSKHGLRCKSLAPMLNQPVGF
jgi:predicted nuclease of restriction endonuclease-like (RecB) superfamily